MITIYTGGDETKFPQSDLFYDLCNMGMGIFDKPENSKIKQRIQKNILLSYSGKHLVVVIKCRHGLHRSVDTAKAIKRDVERLSNIKVDVIHLENC